MTAVEERRGLVQPVYYKAWASSPEQDQHQLTHAVDAGFHIALCGMRTSFQAATWPADPTMWDSSLGRCPTCARVVYGSFERRA